MKLSISIMAHPSRRGWVDGLRASAGGDVPVAWDNGTGIIATCERAWRLYEPRANYHLVLQDDAILCRNFRWRAEKLLASFSTPTAVSFYYGKRDSMRARQSEALRKGCDFGPLRWGVAVCLPTAWVPPMLKFYHARTEPQDDNRIRKFLVSIKQSVFYPVPSLVNHRAGPSLVGDPGSQRVAYRFIDDV